MLYLVFLSLLLLNLLYCFVSCYSFVYYITYYALFSLLLVLFFRLLYHIYDLKKQKYESYTGLKLKPKKPKTKGEKKHWKTCNLHDPIPRKP